MSNLLRFIVRVHSRGQTYKPLMFFTHSVLFALDVRCVWLLVMLQEMRRAKVFDALYLLWIVKAYRNMLRVHPLTVHPRHTFIDPAAMTLCWSDDLQAGRENQPNRQMWTGRSASHPPASNHICVSEQTTTRDAFPLSIMPFLKRSRLHQQMLL